MQNVKIRFAYKSGFRRAWIVSSALWVVFIYLLKIYGMTRVDYSDVATCMLLPPAILYAIGASSVWIIEGFAKAD